MILLNPYRFVAPVPVDWVGDWNAGTVGQLITLANAAASSHGVTGTWSMHDYSGVGDPSPVAITHTYLISGVPARRIPAICGGVLYNGAAGRGIKYDLDAALAGGLYQEGLKMTLNGSVSTKSISVSCLVRYNQIYDPGIGSYSNDTVVTEAGGPLGEYCTAQVEIKASPAIVSRSEAQIPLTDGTTTAKGFNGVIALNTWYALDLRLGGEGRSYAVHSDPDTGVVINASCVACGHNSSGSDIVYFGPQDYLFRPGTQPTGGGKLEYGQMEAAWTHDVFPFRPITVAPINSFTTAAQTALGAITLAWTGIACTFRIERTSNGGSSWTTLADDQVQSKFGAESYVDSTVTYPNTYQYRVTSKIGSRSGTPVSTSPIVMLNSGFTWALDTFESYPNGATDLATVGSWATKAANDFLTSRPTSAHTVISGNLVANHKAALWTGTVSANQRSEITVGLINTSPGYNIMMGAAVRIDSTKDNWYEVIVGCLSGTQDNYSAGTTVLQIRRVNGTTSSTRIGSNYVVPIVSGDQIAIEATGTGSATRLKIQKNLAGAGWVDVATGVDPGATYIDGGNPGISIYTRFGSDAAYSIDTWKSFEI